jgi:uncharacterized membrane protein
MMEQQHNQSLPGSSKLLQHVDQTKAPPPGPQVSAKVKERTALLIGWMLRGGVIVSAAMTVIGLLLLPFRPGALNDRRMEAFPHTLVEVWSGLLGLHPQAIIALGLLLLIATPVLTVTTSAIAFAVERDCRFVVIALIVLAILVTSFALGRNG